MDADLSHDPSFIPRLLSKSDDIVIGSRYIDGGEIIGWKKHREIISKTANSIAKSLLKIKVQDVTSGFRVYSRRAVEIISKEATATGYDFEIEIILLAKKHELSLSEVPITFTDRRRGETKLGFSEMIRFLHLILKNTKL